MIHPRFSKKCQKNETEHVERSHCCSYNSNSPKPSAFLKPLPQDFIFGEKSCKGRNSSNGKRCNEHRFKCDGNAAFQVSHLGEILFASHRVNHASGSKEQ